MVDIIEEIKFMVYENGKATTKIFSNKIEASTYIKLELLKNPKNYYAFTPEPMTMFDPKLENN